MNTNYDSKSELLNDQNTSSTFFNQQIAKYDEDKTNHLNLPLEYYIQTNNRIEKLEKENYEIKETLNSLRLKENKILGRLSLFLIIINVITIVITIIMAIYIINTFKPFLDNLKETNNTAIYVFDTIGAIIIGCIIKIWWDINQFILYMKKKEKQE